MGALVYSGTVHPQLATAWLITNGWSPTLVKMNTHVTLGDDSGNLPKLWVNLSNLISACALAEHTLATNRININTNFFIFFFFLSYFLVYSFSRFIFKISR